MQEKKEKATCTKMIIIALFGKIVVPELPKNSIIMKITSKIRKVPGDLILCSHKSGNYKGL